MRPAKITPADKELSLQLDSDVIVQLRREARMRDTSVDALCRQLFDILAREKLISAVLDDGR